MMVMRLVVMLMLMVIMILIVVVMKGDTQLVQLIMLPLRCTVLSIILRKKSPYDLMKHPNIKETIEALMPYTGEATR